MKESTYVLNTETIQVLCFFPSYDRTTERHNACFENLIRLANGYDIQRFLITYIHPIITCLIELKFCEVSQNSFSNRCWKFQPAFYLDKQKSFIHKKNIFLAVVNIKTKKLCLLTQFSRRFWICWFQKRAWQ